MQTALTRRTSRNRTDLTEGQSRILDKFATIQAELECLVRETKRTRFAIQTKKARGKHDRR